MTPATLSLFDAPPTERAIERPSILGPDRGSVPARVAHPVRARVADTGQAPMRATPAPTEPRPAPSLDEVITGVWTELGARANATCPVCSGSMAPRPGAGAQQVGGRCTSCASTLS